MYRYICEKCNKPHSGNYGSGRFCSSFCARSFSTSKDNLAEKKVIYCSKCNAKIAVNKRASSINFICDSCRNIEKERIRQAKKDKFLIKKHEQLEKYNVTTSPYKEFDTVYENIDSHNDRYLYFTKHNSNNKIVKRCKVYLYRYNIEYLLGRRLSENEVIHHIDFNHFNNDLDNLIVVNRNIHSKIHANKITIEDVIMDKLFIFKPN